ncbi:MAG: uroporphyrinogen decarboxylase family protein [Nitrososphaeria archaeon]
MTLLEYFSSFNRIPVVPIVGYPALVSLKMTAQECLLYPEKHVKLVDYMRRKYSIDALLPLLDLTVEAEALGAKIKYRGKEAPQIEKNVSINDINIDYSKNRIPIFVKTAEMIKKGSNELPTGFYITGPFTIAGQVIGITNLLRFTLTSPETLYSILDKIAEISLYYSRELERVGINFIIIAEPSSSLISATQFNEFSKPYLIKLVKNLKTDAILHVCGKSKHLLKEMIETKAAGISIDQNISLEEAVSTLPSDMLVFGNYSPVDLMLEQPLTIRKNVLKMLTPVKDKNNIVSSTGCDIPTNTPEENIKTFIETSKSIKRNKIIYYKL